MSVVYSWSFNLLTFSQKAGPFGRVSFEPNENGFSEEIHSYIEKNLNVPKSQIDLSKKADSRGARRITFDILDGKLKYSPKPERMRELAKNLWKLQSLPYCAKEKTIQYLINIFPELNVLIKENETSKRNLDQKNEDAKRRKKDVPGEENVKYHAQTKPVLFLEHNENQRKLKTLSAPMKKQKKRKMKVRTSSFSSSSSSSSRPGITSDSNTVINEEKEYDYVNQLEAFDLTYEDDQDSIDQLEATLMDENFIELTNTIR